MTIILSNIQSLIEHYDLLLVDAWGVLHDGRAVFPGAERFLHWAKKRRKPVAIISNAARRNEIMAKELANAGVDGHLYTLVHSSGEMTWQFLLRNADTYQTGFYYGPPRSRSLCHGLPARWAEEIHAADFVLNTGTPMADLNDISLIDDAIRTMVKLQLPMVCANPDQVAVRNGVLGFSAGAIAQRYLQLGGHKLVQFGKPDATIFQQAMQMASITEHKRVLMIGDGMATDIAGASNLGIDSLLICSGIHRQDLMPLDQGKLDTLCEKYRLSPTYACATLDCSE